MLACEHGEEGGLTGAVGALEVPPGVCVDGPVDVFEYLLRIVSSTPFQF